MKTLYNYVVIKENYPELERETVLLHNKYKKNKRYAILNKGVHRDGSESIYFIDYSNDLEELQKLAQGYKSWYNYPIGLAKDVNGNLFDI